MVIWLLQLGNYRVTDNCLISRNKLTIVQNFTTSDDNFTKQHREEISFLITKLSADTLIIQPLSTRAKFYARAKEYHFGNLKKSVDTSFHFKRLVFSSSICYGSCPNLLIEINADGRYYLKGREYSGEHEGYFQGNLSTVLLDSLTSYLQKSRLRQMYAWKQTMEISDTPEYLLVIENNYEKLDLQTNYPPLNLKELISFLLNSRYKLTLTKMPAAYVFKW